MPHAQPKSAEVLPDGTDPASITEKITQTRPHSVTLRALTLGLILLPLNCFWVIRMEKALYGPFSSTISLFANVIFLLFLIVGINRLVQRFSPKLAMRQGELLTIYTILGISTAIAGLDGVGILNQLMPHGAWFAETNHWEFLGSFPSWLVVSDHNLMRGHFLGNSNFYDPAILMMWAKPILAWTVFISLLMLVAHSMSLLLRRRWADQERLTFPITWLPLAMTEEGNGRSFFRNRILWIGFGIAAGLSLWNGLAFLYPSLPAIQLGINDLKPNFTSKPLSAIDWFPITFYPLAIGLGYLLPLDLLFSCWFFFLFWKGQMVVANMFAWDTVPDAPFIKEQGFGSIIGLFLYIVFSGRTYYMEILRSAFRKQQPGSGERGEVSERTAFIGIGTGLLGLLLFCLAAKVTWWVILAFFAIFLPTLIVVSRIRAELGSPVHDFHFMGPDAMLPRLLGSSTFTRSDLAFFTFTYSITRAHRSDAMPVGLEGFQMAKQRGMEEKRLYGAILMATVLATLCSFWAFEHQAYQLGTTAKMGEGNAFAAEAMNRMNSWTSGSLDIHSNTSASFAMGAGILTTLFLAFMRVRFFGFPFHPIGYAISSSWSIHIIWLPLFIAWVAKSVVMRYGGLATYRQYLPFFLGLALGDCVMGSVWGILSMILNMRTYNFFGV